MLRHTPQLSEKTLAECFALFKKQKPESSLPPSVIIIGAGLSGIAAANELLSAGFIVTLLEARDRVGGRIHSHRLKNGSYIEFGAQFLHGRKENPLLPLLDEFKIKLQPIYRSQSAAYDKSGKEIKLSDLNAFIQAYKDEIFSLNQKRLSDSKDRFSAQELQTLIQTLELKSRHNHENHQELSELAKRMLLGDTQESSLFAYKLGLEQKEEETNFLVTNGFDNLLKELIKTVPNPQNFTLKLSEVVKKIENKAECVTITTESGHHFSADMAICTLPLGVLQQGSVQFVPFLPEAKLKAIGQLRNANHNKIILEFEKAFWDNKAHIIIPYDKENKAWLDIVNLQAFVQDSNETNAVLVVSTHGAFVSNDLSDQQKIDHILALLKSIFGTNLSPLKEAWVTHWDSDPYSMGAYCYHSERSSLETNSEIARPIGRLCFAGEHTHRDPSNVYGAYLSGLEAAKQVVYQLQGILKNS